MIEQRERARNWSMRTWMIEEVEWTRTWSEGVRTPRMIEELERERNSSEKAIVSENGTGRECKTISLISGTKRRATMTLPAPLVSGWAPESSSGLTHEFGDKRSRSAAKRSAKQSQSIQPHRWQEDSMDAEIDDTCWPNCRSICHKLDWGTADSGL